TGWEAPAHAATEVVATEDVIWSAPPPAEPAEDWKAEAPSPDWQEVKSAEAPAPEAPADWSTLSSGPDWSSPPLAEPAAAEPAWDAAAPPPAESQWEAAPAAPAEVESEWAAPPPPPAPAATDPGWSPPADQSTEWSAPAEPAPGPAWNAPAVGASALEQLDSDPIEAVPGAAQDLFGSVPDGGSLAGDDEFGPPEALASPEDVLKAIPQEIDHHDPDLPVPVDDGPARPRP